MGSFRGVRLWAFTVIYLRATAPLCQTTDTFWFQFIIIIIIFHNALWSKRWRLKAFEKIAQKSATVFNMVFFQNLTIRCIRKLLELNLWMGFQVFKCTIRKRRFRVKWWATIYIYFFYDFRVVYETTVPRDVVRPIRARACVSAHIEITERFHVLGPACI